MYISFYNRQAQQQRRPNNQPAPPAPPAEQPRPREIRTIIGGPGQAGTSNRARKTYTRRAKRGAEHLEIMQTVNQSGRRTADTSLTITFTEEEAAKVMQPHDDALVVTLKIANHTIHRVLVDSGSSVDVIFKSAYDQMGIAQGKLKSAPTPLYGFAGDKVQPDGSIELPVTAGSSPNQSTVMTNFLIVNTPSVYNVILGRPTLNALRAVTSTYHLSMKFPTTQGIGEVSGNQFESRRCYSLALQQKGEQRSAGNINAVETVGSLNLAPPARQNLTILLQRLSRQSLSRH